MEDTSGQFQFTDCSSITSTENNPQDQSIALQPYSITKSEFEAMKEEVLEPTDHMECDSVGDDVLQEFSNKEEIVKIETNEEELKPPLTVFLLPDLDSGVDQQEEQFCSREKGELFRMEETSGQFQFIDCLSITTENNPQEFSIKEEIVKIETNEEELKPPLTVFLLPDLDSGVDQQEFSIKKEIVKSETKEEELKPPLTVFLMPDLDSGVEQQVEDSVKCCNTVKTTNYKRQYQCETCNKLFSLKGSLIRHQADVHSGLKAFVCDTCKKSFSRKSSLITHLAIVHSGLKPFVCDTCKKSFGENGKLINHQAAVHSGLKRFVCDTCKKSFGHKRSLIKHQATVLKLKLKSNLNSLLLMSRKQ